MTDSLSGRLADRVVGIARDTIPEQVVQTVTTGFIDFAACLLLGFAAPVNAMLRKAAVNSGPARGEEAHAYFSDLRLSSMDAALLNSASAHASNIDDNALKGSHVSSVLAPAILAEAERLGLGGAAAIAAYVAGYEVWAVLAAADEDSYNAAGWHQTTALSPVAVAAAIANLRGVDAATAENAMGIAASMTGGLVANFNPFVKPYQVGRSSAAGIQAVSLAMAGMKASTGALEGVGGLLPALSPKGAWSVDDTDLTQWQILKQGLNLKQYPNAATNHRALDGIFQLMRDYGVKASDVQRVVVPITRHQYDVILSRLPSPPAIAPLLMVELAISAALHHGRLDSGDFSPSNYQRPDRAALASRVEIEVLDASAEDLAANLGYRADVSVILQDGRKLTASPAAVARGHFTMPFSADELRAKFIGAAASVGQEASGAELFRALQGLDSIEHLSRLPRLAVSYAV